MKLKAQKDISALIFSYTFLEKRSFGIKNLLRISGINFIPYEITRSENIICYDYIRNIRIRKRFSFDPTFVYIHLIKLNSCLRVRTQQIHSISVCRQSSTEDRDSLLERKIITVSHDQLGPHIIDNNMPVITIIKLNTVGVC